MPFSTDLRTSELVYILRFGDSLAKIAKHASARGQVVAMKNILDANPGLHPARLRVGQKIFIPVSNGHRDLSSSADSQQQP
jgi:hypothetical protein